MQPDDWAVIDDDDELLEPDAGVPEDVLSTLYEMKDAIFRHPMVVQAAFGALVAEGKRFAETEEGANLRDRLLTSPSTASARLVWELLTTHAFSEETAHVLPSAFMERFVRLLSIRGIEPLVSRLFERLRQ